MSVQSNQWTAISALCLENGRWPTVIMHTAFSCLNCCSCLLFVFTFFQCFNIKVLVFWKAVPYLNDVIFVLGTFGKIPQCRKITCKLLLLNLLLLLTTLYFFVTVHSCKARPTFCTERTICARMQWLYVWCKETGKDDGACGTRNRVLVTNYSLDVALCVE